MVSMAGSKKRSRTDILALKEEKAATLLHAHLTKSCFGGEDSDNLMSWTSSLLFAIQYAIWRLNIGRHSASDIKICVVCTDDFPPGQFMRDVPLLEAYRSTAQRLDSEIPRFFDFRLGSEDYYNGEYLSQGAVNISKRSCVVSLQQLIDAGLYRLYPEFEDADGKTKWAKRVRDFATDGQWSTKRWTRRLNLRLHWDASASSRSTLWKSLASFWLSKTAKVRS
jgi:hypothetical protein